MKVYEKNTLRNKLRIITNCFRYCYSFSWGKTEQKNQTKKAAAAQKKNAKYNIKINNKHYIFEDEKEILGDVLNELEINKERMIGTKKYKNSDNEIAIDDEIKILDHSKIKPLYTDLSGFPSETRGGVLKNYLSDRNIIKKFIGIDGKTFDDEIDAINNINNSINKSFHLPYFKSSNAKNENEVKAINPFNWRLNNAELINNLQLGDWKALSLNNEKYLLLSKKDVQKFIDWLTDIILKNILDKRENIYNISLYWMPNDQNGTSVVFKRKYDKAKSHIKWKKLKAINGNCEWQYITNPNDFPKILSEDKERKEIFESVIQKNVNQNWINKYLLNEKYDTFDKSSTVKSLQKVVHALDHFYSIKITLNKGATFLDFKDFEAELITDKDNVYTKAWPTAKLPANIMDMWEPWSRQDFDTNFDLYLNVRYDINNASENINQVLKNALNCAKNNDKNKISENQWIFLTQLLDSLVESANSINEWKALIQEIRKGREIKISKNTINNGNEENKFDFFKYFSNDFSSNSLQNKIKEFLNNNLIFSDIYSVKGDDSPCIIEHSDFEKDEMNVRFDNISHLIKHDLELENNFKIIYLDSNKPITLDSIDWQKHAKKYLNNPLKAVTNKYLSTIDFFQLIRHNKITINNKLWSDYNKNEKDKIKSDLNELIKKGDILFMNNLTLARTFGSLMGDTYKREFQNNICFFDDKLFEMRQNEIKKNICPQKTYTVVGIENLDFEEKIDSLQRKHRRIFDTSDKKIAKKSYAYLLNEYLLPSNDKVWYKENNFNRWQLKSNIFNVYFVKWEGEKKVFRQL